MPLSREEMKSIFVAYRKWQLHGKSATYWTGEVPAVWTLCIRPLLLSCFLLNPYSCRPLNSANRLFLHTVIRLTLLLLTFFCIISASPASYFRDSVAGYFC
jgi:hypothetical protein